MPETGADEHERRIAVGEGSYDTGTASDFLHDAFKAVVRAQTRPMLTREAHVRQRFLDALLHELRHAVQLHISEFFGDQLGFLTCRILVFLSVDRFQHRRHKLDFALRTLRKRITMPVNHAPLPFPSGKKSPAPRPAPWIYPRRPTSAQSSEKNKEKNIFPFLKS